MSEYKHTPGPYRAIGSAIYADAPQDVDHSHYKGFGEPEPDRGYLIAESIPHNPTRDLLTAAPDLLESLKQFVEEYVEMVNSGDCGFWDPEKEDKVIKARAAISKALTP